MIAGIGVDIVRKEKIAAAVARHGSCYLSRILTDLEVAHCQELAYPIDGYATLFAIKEAVFKALGVGWRGGLQWDQVEIIRKQGRLSLVTFGAAKQRFLEMGVVRSHIEGVDMGEHVLASVILEL